jgi:putrescine transport system substrate-binding protein
MMLRFLCSAALSLGLAVSAFSATASAEDKVLNVYNWSDYVAPDTIANFEKETGIKVRYDLFESYDSLYAKLLAGHSDYDVVFPSAWVMGKMIKAGVFHKLDKSKLGNTETLNPTIMKVLAQYDPGNEHAVPYMRWSTGIAYDVDKVKKLLPNAPLDSAALIFDPANAEKLSKCGIEMVDSSEEIVGMALGYLGKNPLSTDPADLKAAQEMMAKIRPYMKKIGPGIYNDLANGEACVAVIWSGDFRLATDAIATSKSSIKLHYMIPKEGSFLGLDAVAIPSDAPHYENALLFINYLMRPDVIAGITNFVHYANANPAADKLVSADIRNDPVTYPTDEILRRLLPMEAKSDQGLRAVTRLWTSFMSGH